MKKWILGILILLSTIFIGCERNLLIEDPVLNPDLKSADLTLPDETAFAKPSLDQGGYVFAGGIKTKANPENYPMLNLTKNQWGWAANISKTILTNRMKDIDGNIYHTVTIGDQIWMAENIKVTHLNDKTPIPLITDNSAWLASGPDRYSGGGSPVYCWYNNDKETYEYMGALYTWHTAQNSNFAPNGWRVPSLNDYLVLGNLLGTAQPDPIPLAGGKLKEAGLTHWADPNVGATNESGFNAIPIGIRNPEKNGDFEPIYNTGAAFWTIGMKWDGLGWMMALTNSNDKMYVGNTAWLLTAGFPVRCIKNDNIPAIVVTDLEFPIYSGAGLNTVSKGVLVGKALVSYDGTVLKVKYDLDEGYKMSVVNIYASDIQPGTTIPEQFGFAESFDPVINGFETTIEVLDINGDGKIWLILHAKVQ